MNCVGIVYIFYFIARCAANEEMNCIQSAHDFLDSSHL